MPNEEFVRLLALIDAWSTHNKEYVWESSLKDDAPEYVRAALENLKAIQKELDEENVCV